MRGCTDFSLKNLIRSYFIPSSWRPAPTEKIVEAKEMLAAAIARPSNVPVPVRAIAVPRMKPATEQIAFNTLRKWNFSVCSTVLSTSGFALICFALTPKEWALAKS